MITSYQRESNTHRPVRVYHRPSAPTRTMTTRRAVMQTHATGAAGRAASPVWNHGYKIGPKRR